ncbi:MAG: hypothetical protein ACRD1B_10985 [Thermoanaerobaculia bacterium]
MISSALRSPAGLFPAVSLRGTCEYLILSLYFYFPVSMPLRYAAHAVLDPQGRWSFLGYPETIAIPIALVLAFATARQERGGTLRRIDSGFVRLLWFAGAYAAAVAASSLLQGSNPDFAIRKIGMEWILPILLAIAFRWIWTPDLDLAVRRALVNGTLLLAAVALCTYLLSFGVPRSFQELIFTNRTWLIWKGMKGQVSFGEIPFGGVNPLAAHVATVWCIVLAALGSSTTRLCSLLVGIPLMLVELLCYSRGVLLFLVGAAAATATVLPEARRRARAVAVLALPLVLVVGTICLGGTSYWLAQAEARPGSSAASRILQWLGLASVQPVSRGELPPGAMAGYGLSQEQARVLNERLGGPTRRLLLGYGLGHYGLLRGLVPDSGSHNIFLDALIEGGVVGLALFLGFFGFGLWRRWRAWRETRVLDPAARAAAWSRLLALASIVVIGVLVDYRLENLGTMTGSAVLWLLLVAPVPAFSGESFSAGLVGA